MSGPGVVIVGSSVAGCKTAQSLRSEGYRGRITVVGGESGLPYDKPPLSKQVLVGSMDPDENILLTAAEARAAEITLRLGTAAAALDTEGRLVKLVDGEEIPYGTLVIATGVRARPSPWGLPAGAHLLRTAKDAVALREDLRAGGELVVVGGGFIGSEVAATARGLGVRVRIVDPATVPSARVLGPEAGGLLSRLHTRHDVETFFGVGVEDITTDPSRKAPSGRPALCVQLDTGSRLCADTVLVGIGTVPNDEWLADSGVRVDDGVVCDEFSRAVGVSDVYAAGDIARWFHPRHGAHVRVEHWTTAVEHAQCVAHNIVHPDDRRPFVPVEYIWSDQYDWKIQITGRTGGDRQRVLRPDPSVDRLAVLYADGRETLGGRERLGGAATINWPKALIACRRAIGADVTIDELAGVLGADRLPPADHAMAVSEQV